MHRPPHLVILAVGGAMAIAGSALGDDRLSSAGLSISGAWLTLWLRSRGQAKLAESKADPEALPPGADDGKPPTH